MIALYIILGIALLIGIILLLRLKLIIEYDIDLKVYLKFLFIKFSLFPEKPKKKRKSKKKKIKNKSEKINVTNTTDTDKKDDSIVTRLWSIRKVLLYTIEKFLGKVHFKFVRLNIVVGGENAASTALLYGAATQGVSFLLEILNNISNVDISKNSDISVKSDFLSQKSSIIGKIILYISVAHLVYVFIHFLKNTIKSKMKTEE